MNRKIAALMVTVSIIAGIGLGFIVQRLNDGSAEADEPTDTSSATTPPPSEPTDDRTDLAVPLEEVRNDRSGPSWSPRDPVDADGNVIEIGHIVPGGLEPVKVGMTVAQATATGLIVRDTEREQICEGTHYRWVDDLADGFDAAFDPNGNLVSIGIGRDGAETAEGISIGNSYGMLKRVYGDRLSEVEVAGYDQDGAFVRDGDRWIGFLFDSARDGMTDSSRITFIEVTTGNKPGLMRDGC